jgi:hypothetical protein
MSKPKAEVVTEEAPATATAAEEPIDIVSMVRKQLASKVGDAAAAKILASYADVQAEIVGRKHNTSYIAKRLGMQMVLKHLGVPEEAFRLLRAQLLRK